MASYPSTSVAVVNNKEAEDAAVARTVAIESLRKVCHVIGIVQVILGLLGLLASFAYISCILSLSLGAVSVSAWKSLNSAMRYFDRNSTDCCCDPSQGKGLAISIIVFSIIELLAFAWAWPIGVFFIAVANVEAKSASGNTYALPLAPRATITWIGLAIVLAAVLSAINLALAIAQMCMTDKLLAVGSRSGVYYSQQPSVTVVTMTPVPGQPQAGGMTMQPGYPVVQPGPGQAIAIPYQQPGQQYMVQHYAQQPYPGQQQYAGYPQQGGYSGNPYQQQQPMAPPPGMMPMQHPAAGQQGTGMAGSMNMALAAPSGAAKTL